jgi:hypothetical protein
MQNAAMRAALRQQEQAQKQGQEQSQENDGGGGEKKTFQKRKSEKFCTCTNPVGHCRRQAYT